MKELMNAFKVGDKVIVRQSKVNDLESDFLQDLSDRSLSGRRYDALIEALRNRKPFEVTAIVEHGYELKVAGSNHRLGYVIDAKDLKTL